MRRNLPAVIVVAEHQRQLVQKLAQHCDDLSGVKLQILEAPEATNLPYPKCNDAAFHFASVKFKGKAFCWMEPDAIPLKEDWLRAITDEYYKGGKEFMLSSDSNPPWDVVGGIGVYGPNTHWYVPKTFQENAWDMWMWKHARPITHTTPLIQHSYGKYFNGVAEPHRFPKDQHILRPDAVLFHRDKFQDLIEPPSGQTVDPERRQVVFRHGGDIGDVLAALPILRELGGGKVVLFHDAAAPKGMRPRQSLEGERYEALKPLLEVQPYISSVEWGTGTDIKGFRETPRPKYESLTERQARHFGRWPIKLHPWLEVPKAEQHNRVIVARSPRYHAVCPFPWKEAYEAYGDRLLFVGLPEEHEAFEKVIEHPVEFANTKNFLEVAKLMAGAPQIIANQSSPLWVAIGLGSKIICEGHATYPNSQLPRPGSFWAYVPEDMDVVRRAFAKVKAK